MCVRFCVYTMWVCIFLVCVGICMCVSFCVFIVCVSIFVCTPVRECICMYIHNLCLSLNVCIFCVFMLLVFWNFYCFCSFNIKSIFPCNPLTKIYINVFLHTFIRTHTHTTKHIEIPTHTHSKHTHTRTFFGMKVYVVT